MGPGVRLELSNLKIRLRDARTRARCSIWLDQDVASAGRYFGLRILSDISPTMGILFIDPAPNDRSFSSIMVLFNVGDIHRLRDTRFLE